MIAIMAGRASAPQGLIASIMGAPFQSSGVPSKARRGRGVLDEIAGRSAGGGGPGTRRDAIATDEGAGEMALVGEARGGGGIGERGAAGDQRARRVDAVLHQIAMRGEGGPGR